MRPLAIASLVLLLGCHNRLRLASPQIQRAPEIVCIVVVQSDTNSAEIARSAVEACRGIERKKPNDL